MYGGSGVVGDDGGSVGGGDWLSESADSMLDLLSNLYSDSNVFFYKS